MRKSFEEACRIVKLSAEDLKGCNVEAVRTLLKKRQEEAGWTTSELAEESGRRMKLRIKEIAWAEEAIERRIAEGDFDYADSYRHARKDDPFDCERFESLRTCCGQEEWEETGPDGNVYLLGFNYGH